LGVARGALSSEPSPPETHRLTVTIRTPSSAAISVGVAPARQRSFAYASARSRSSLGYFPRLCCPRYLDSAARNCTRSLLPGIAHSSSLGEGTALFRRRLACSRVWLGQRRGLRSGYTDASG